MHYYVKQFDRQDIEVKNGKFHSYFINMHVKKSIRIKRVNVITTKIHSIFTNAFDTGIDNLSK